MPTYLRATFAFVCLVWALPFAAAAQTSSAAIVREVMPAGVVRAEPVRALDILDTDYPLESLRENQTGRVGLNLQIDKTGRVRLVQIIGNSGFPALDAKAAQIAATWSFRPATKDDAPIPSELKVDAIWKLPLKAARLTPR